MRVIDLKTGKATKHHGNERHIFGEGLTLWENTLVQIACVSLLTAPCRARCL